MDLATIGGSLASVGLLAGGAWAWVLKTRKAQAETRADVAESDSARTVADAQQTVYKLLIERVTTLEADMRQVRAELTTERAHSRKLELHIWRLEGLMRKANLEPPAFVDDPVK
jgi:hypothetical protein